VRGEGFSRCRPRGISEVQSPEESGEGLVSVKYEEYRHNADHCLQMALTVSSDSYRVSWLKLAQAWLQMIPADQLKTAKETYEAIVHLRATHAKDLKSSH
jgi:hypothetical protein